MNFGPVTKFDKKNTTALKELTMTSIRHIVTSLSFQFMAKLEQPGSRILDVWSVKLTFSLIVTFYLRKTEYRTKKSLTHSQNIALSKGTISAKNAEFFAKKC